MQWKNVKTREFFNNLLVIGARVLAGARQIGPHLCVVQHLSVPGQVWSLEHVAAHGNGACVTGHAPGLVGLTTVPVRERLRSHVPNLEAMNRQGWCSEQIHSPGFRHCLPQLLRPVEQHFNVPVQSLSTVHWMTQLPSAFGAGQVPGFVCCWPEGKKQWTGQRAKFQGKKRCSNDNAETQAKCMGNNSHLWALDKCIHNHLNSISEFHRRWSHQPACTAGHKLQHPQQVDTNLASSELQLLKKKKKKTFTTFSGRLYRRQRKSFDTSNKEKDKNLGCDTVYHSH